MVGFCSAENEFLEGAVSQCVTRSCHHQGQHQQFVCKSFLLPGLDKTLWILVKRTLLRGCFCLPCPWATHTIQHWKAVCPKATQQLSLECGLRVQEWRWSAKVRKEEHAELHFMSLPAPLGWLARRVSPSVRPDRCSSAQRESKASWRLTGRRELARGLRTGLAPWTSLWGGDQNIPSLCGSKRCKKIIYLPERV